MDSADSMWLGHLKNVLHFGSDAAPNGQPTLEIQGVTSRINMTRPIVSQPSRRISYSFMVAEAYWILSGDNSLKPLLNHAPSIRRFSDDGSTLFGAYGPRVKAQLDYVLKTLIDDPDSRRAIIGLWTPSPPPSKDIPCTLGLQWIIRNKHIHCIASMRSSDLWLGWPYDVFSFTMLTALIALRLKVDGLQISIGELVLFAGSQHLYQTNVKRAQECVTKHGLIPYKPFNLALFANDCALLEFLQRASTSRCNHLPWMREFFSAGSGV